MSNGLFALTMDKNSNTPRVNNVCVDQDNTVQVSVCL